LDKVLERSAREALALIANNGGGTFERDTLLPFTPKVGYAVGLGGVKLPAAVVEAETLTWISRVVAGEHGTSYWGAWVDGNVIHFDAVQYFGPERRSAALLAGYQHDQQAIYDFAAGESIYLGEEAPL
jgi:hypothetical protein